MDGQNCGSGAAGSAWPSRRGGEPRNRVALIFIDVPMKGMVINPLPSGYSKATENGLVIDGL